MSQRASTKTLINQQESSYGVNQNNKKDEEPLKISVIKDSQIKVTVHNLSSPNVRPSIRKGKAKIIDKVD